MAKPLWRMPIATVDVVIFGILEDALHVLLVKRAARADEPFPGRWALPGGFVDIDRDGTIEDAALRKLREKTGLDAPYLEQLGTFGGRDRDPRGWSVTTVYFALVPADPATLTPGGNTEEAKWFPLRDDRVNAELAFDHAAILAAAVARLRNKVEYTSLPIHLLPAEFTLVELQQVFEIVLGRKVEKSAFRRRLLAAKVLVPVERYQEGRTRPAMLYRLKRGAKGGVVFFPRSLQPNWRA